MSGSGGGGGGGGGFEPPTGDCATLAFDTQLSSPKAAVVATLKGRICWTSPRRSWEERPLWSCFTVDKWPAASPPPLCNGFGNVSRTAQSSRLVCCPSPRVKYACTLRRPGSVVSFSGTPTADRRRCLSGALSAAIVDGSVWIRRASRICGGGVGCQSAAVVLYGPGHPACPWCKSRD